ncbi:unnamed protein product, partial [Prorocentrum cordatum]
TQTAHWQAKGCACRLRGEGLLRDPATWCDGLRATRCFHSPWSHLDVRQSPTSASSGSAAQQEATADRFCTRGLRAVSRGIGDPLARRAHRGDPEAAGGAKAGAAARSGSSSSSSSRAEIFKRRWAVWARRAPRCSPALAPQGGGAWQGMPEGPRPTAGPDGHARSGQAHKTLKRRGEGEARRGEVE